MAKARSTNSSSGQQRRRPALTPEARENQMIAMAMDLVEQRLLDGTASSQETTHFLKLGSSKAVLERDRLIEENKLLRAKTKELESREKSEELYKKAMKAFASYSGHGEEEADDDY